MDENKILLGKQTQYPEHFQPELLFPIPRQEKRDELGLGVQLPFSGFDVWNAYELSWLNDSGMPQVAIAVFEFDCQSPNIIESKSFKLYLNSYNQTRFESWQQVERQLDHDLSQASESRVRVALYSLHDYNQHYPITQPQGIALDKQQLTFTENDFVYEPSLLRCSQGAGNVQERLYSDLLKSNCLITSQPDWATVEIDYQGQAICHESLLRYIVAFRNHNEFHEQCVERIFCDIMRYCQPQELTVSARYTRRGGLDINPYRSTKASVHSDAIQNPRHSRQ